MQLASSSLEKRLRLKGYQLIAGVDEAGRGPLAGPIVAAAVILSPDSRIKGLADSKLLSPAKRERIFRRIRAAALDIGLARLSPKIIDRLKIGRANLLAMKLAVEDLTLAPDFLLLDGGGYKLDLPLPQHGITGGDRKHAAIAAASIIAKVSRDRLMLGYHRKYPAYGFHRHKGYGTRRHLKMLRQLGPCAIHRRSFAPIKTLN